MSPFGDMFSARLGLSAQADRRPKAPSPDFQSAGSGRPCNPLEVCQQVHFIAGRALETLKVLETLQGLGLALAPRVATRGSAASAGG